MYWIEAVYATKWLTADQRKELLGILWRAESSGGWTLVTSYRIPILWEHVHLHFAKTLYEMKEANKVTQ
jgi:hypothetical protein